MGKAETDKTNVLSINKYKNQKLLKEYFNKEYVTDEELKKVSKILRDKLYIRSK